MVMTLLIRRRVLCRCSVWSAARERVADKTGTCAMRLRVVCCIFCTAMPGAWWAPTAHAFSGWRLRILTPASSRVSGFA